MAEVRTATAALLDGGEDTETEMEFLRPPGKRRKRDPRAPKLPMSAYLFYVSEQRPILARTHPEYSFREVATIIGRRWKLLSKEERRPYDLKAKHDRERFDTEKEEYNRRAERQVVRPDLPDVITPVQPSGPPQQQPPPQQPVSMLQQVEGLLFGNAVSPDQRQQLLQLVLMRHNQQQQQQQQQQQLLASQPRVEDQLVSLLKLLQAKLQQEQTVPQNPLASLLAMAPPAPPPMLQQLLTEKPVSAPPPSLPLGLPQQPVAGQVERDMLIALLPDPQCVAFNRCFPATPGSVQFEPPANPSVRLAPSEFSAFSLP